jgi:DNA-binding NarL/FixJ family response regulator
VIRVAVADDQQLIRGGFRALLDNEPDITVVGEAGSGTQAVELVRAQKPDVLLMDIRMPDGDGLWATEQITADESLSATRIVIVTTFELDEYVARAIRAGASGFLVKDTEPVELIRAVRVVASGEALLSPGVTRRLIELVSRAPGSLGADESVADESGADESVGSSPDARRLEVLTTREREVLGQVGAGLTNDEIGRALFLSPLTAKTHVSRIMTKLGARDRVQLVIIAYETGLVSSP